jgi:hypothetical protein
MPFQHGILLCDIAIDIHTYSRRVEIQDATEVSVIDTQLPKAGADCRTQFRKNQQTRVGALWAAGASCLVEDCLAPATFDLGGDSDVAPIDG